MGAMIDAGSDGAETLFSYERLDDDDPIERQAKQRRLMKTSTRESSVPLQSSWLKRATTGHLNRT